MTNKALAKSIKSFLLSHGGKLEKIFPDSMEVWSISGDEKISLPVDNLIDHKQSEFLLKEAVETISEVCEISVKEIKESFLDADFDFLSVRASGKSIPYGKIKYEEGLASLKALFDIIKYSANKSIQTKGKGKLVKEYLNGVNMLVPEAGSFIYRAQMELTKCPDESDNNNFEDVESIGRYVNSYLATTLQKTLNVMRSVEEPTPALLMKEGIDSKFCDIFLKLFANCSETLEFKFGWSLSEQNSERLPNVVAFTVSEKEKIQSYKRILKDSKVRTYKDLSAIIERYCWPEGKDVGTVTFKVDIDGTVSHCLYETDNELYMSLKELEPEHRVSLSGKFVTTKEIKKKVEIISLSEIKLDNNQSLNLELF